MRRPTWRGLDISLFDKSRGVAGRLSTRRSDSHQFDHGAQYFRAVDARFVEWLKPFEAAGHARAWSPRHVMIGADSPISPREEAMAKRVFAPGMNMIGKALLAGRPQWRFYLDTGIEAIDGTSGAWVLRADAQHFGPFALVVLAMPAVQALALLPDAVGFADDLQGVKQLGCHTLMLGYDANESPAADWDCAHFDDDMLGFAAFNNSKPGRAASSGAALVVQTRHDWSEAHIEDDVADIAEQMKARLTALTGFATAASAYDRIHRWRYASTATPAGVPFLYDEAQGVAAIGDWCIGSKVEDAFLSGHQLGLRLRG